MNSNQKVILLDTHEDVVNIDLGISGPFHIPFHCLQRYYDGGIHRPEGKVGQGRGNCDAIGHEIVSLVDMFPRSDLKGSWFENGVWIGPHHYDCYEALGMHSRCGPGACQELLVYTIDSVNANRPVAGVMRNFTEMTDFKIPVESIGKVAKYHGWSKTIAANLPKIKHSWGDEPECDNIIYVGSGPSLAKNWQELLKLDRSKCQVWAANEAYSFLNKHGVHVDCFFCIDATSPDRWWKGMDCSETKLVVVPFVNPEITDADWKKVCWFNIAGNGYHYNLVREAYPELFELDATRGVGSALIESTWFKKAKRVVMVGCDFCYEIDNKERKVKRSVWHHANEEEYRKLVTNYGHLVVKMINGEWSMTYIGLAIEAAAVFGAAECLWEKGVEVINATEGGCLALNPSAEYVVKKQAERGSNVLNHKTLAEAVKLVNES